MLKKDERLFSINVIYGEKELDNEHNCKLIAQAIAKCMENTPKWYHGLCKPKKNIFPKK